MIPLLNWHGYTARDPLDGLTTRAKLLSSCTVTFAVCVALLSIVFDVLHVATLHPAWLFWVECLAVPLLYTPVVLLFRKSNSVFLAAMLAAVMIPVDIWVEAHVRSKGHVAPWMYSPDGVLGGMHPLLRILVVWGVDGMVMGPVALWLTRTFVALFRAPSAHQAPTDAQRAALFTDEWCAEKLTEVHHDLSYWVLRIVGLVYLSYAGLLLLGLLGPEPWPSPVRELLTMTYANPALTINTFIKVSFVVNLAFAGAYDRHIRFHVCGILFAAHLISTVASIFFATIAPPGDPNVGFLWASAVADGLMGAFLLWSMLHHRTLAKSYAPDRAFPDFFSVPQRLTSIFWRIFAVGAALIPVGVIGIRLLFDPGRGFGAVYGYPDPMVCNTITKYSTMSLIAFVIGPRERLRDKLVLTIVDGFVVSVATSVIWVLFGDLVSDVRVHTRVQTLANVDWYFAFNIGMDAPFAALVLAIRRLHYTVDYGIASLDVASARAAFALHETLYPTMRDHGKIVRSIDRHVAGIRGRKRGILNLPFWALENLCSGLLGLRPHFSVMSADERRYWLRKYLLRPPRERNRSFVPLIAEAAYRIGSAAHAFVTLAHYSEPASRGRIGYVPPEARARLQGAFPGAPPPSDVAQLPVDPEDEANFESTPERPASSEGAAALSRLIAPRVVTVCSESSLPDQVDYLIVGSGAGGAVVAYRLAQRVEDPTRILVVERGPRLSPLVDFGRDEMESLRKLYKEGGLQQTRRFGMTILQGECVGGSTVINNACCARMPDAVRVRWAEDFGLELPELDTAYETVANEIGITEISELAVNRRVREQFYRLVDAYNAENPALTRADIKSNHRNPFGTGLDNVGDRQMRKRSMLETYVAWAEARGVKIVPETTAIRFIGHNRRAEAVLVQTSMGVTRRIVVKKAVIASGGVIASSHFLMRSELGNNVGRNVACNFALPSVLEFDRELDAFDGLQITDGVLDPESRAIFETYFNPPAAFSIALPFYFERHERTLERYRYLLSIGALVGSEARGVIDRKASILYGRALSWSLGADDVGNLKFALKTLARLAGAGGAKRFVMRMEPGVDFEPTKRNVERFCKALDGYPLDLPDLALATAHPQGGNRMATDGSKGMKSRVIDDQFRVDGWNNVYVADASVFPTGITVNPQWTIMALASIAAERIRVAHETGRSTPPPPQVMTGERSQPTTTLASAAKARVATRFRER